MASIAQFLASIVVVTIVFYISKLVKHRRFYAKLPGPPHHFLWGHLKLWGETDGLFPLLPHYHAVVTTLAHKFKLPGIFYIDFWPLGPETLVITDPTFAYEYLTTRKLPKHHLQADFLDPIIGLGNMVTANGPRWKTIRIIFAPAFSTTHTFGMTSLIASDVHIFHDKLRQRAEDGKPFRLEDLINALAFDLAFELIFGMPAGAQGEGSADLKNLNTIINREITMRSTWNPMKKARLRREKEASIKSLDESIISKVTARFNAIKEKGIKLSSKRGLSILDLILRDRTRDNEAVLDPEFIEVAVSSIKTLFLAGSSTIGDTLCFAFMLLSVNPEIVYKLREEHARVFSSDIKNIHELLQTEPQRLKNLEYTSCVLKETLRMYPVGNTGRSPDTPSPIMYNGKEYPVTPKMIISPVQHTWQVSADVFPDPDTFNPDRFIDMDKAGINAWAPFGKGHRACIGQELAMEEMKTVLLYSIQFFDFTCYDLKPNKTPRVPWTKMDLIFGDRAFQEFVSEAGPRDGMPMVVKRVK